MVTSSPDSGSTTKYRTFTDAELVVLLEQRLGMSPILDELIHRIGVYSQMDMDTYSCNCDTSVQLAICPACDYTTEAIE